MNPTLENGWEVYKGLYNVMLSSTKTVLTLSNMLKSLKETVENYSRQIQNIAEKFHQEISVESAEDDILFFYYQYLSNYLLRVAHDNKGLGKNIQSEIIDPFEMFVQNFRTTNRSTATKGKEMLIKLEDARAESVKSQENYWKLSKQAEKSGDLIEKTIMLMDQGLRTQQDLQKASDKSVKLKIMAQESEQSYKSQIEICNESWKIYEKEYPGIFTSFDYNDESRVSFTKQTINNLTKLMMDFQQQESKYDAQYQEKLQDYEEKFWVDAKKFPCLKLIQKGKNEQFKVIKPEEFISYETHKRDQEVDYQIEDDFIVIGANENQMTETDKQKLDKFIESIFKQKENNGNNQVRGLSASQSSVNSQENNNGKQQEEEEQKQENQAVNLKQQQINERQNYILGLNEILKVRKSRNYFLEILWKKILANKQYHIKCNDEQFTDLQEILISILQNNNAKESFNPEEFYGVLQVASRIMRIPNQKKQTVIIGENLSKKLNTQEIFQKNQNWELLYDFISNKKIEEKISKRKFIMQSSEQGFIKGGVKKSFNIVSKGLGFGLNLIGIGQGKHNNKKDSVDLNENDKNEINFLMLEDINCFLLNLQLSTDFSTQIIIDMAQKNDITNEQIQKLLERQEDKKNDEIRKYFYSYKHKSQRIQKKVKKIETNYQQKFVFAVKQSMKYLSSEDKPWNLMLVSRECQKQFEKKIFKLFLMRDLNKNQFLKDNRIKIYKAWLKTDLYKHLDYEKLKEDMKKSQQGQEKQSRIDEIIELDVHRSLHIHKEDISQQTLQNLLKTFAYENQVISYCQGMNYIAGYLYLIIRDESETYKQFHIIMNLYFQDLFTNQFQRLKIMFYQLSRCLSIFLPQLSDHLKQENIDPEYYATGWFITIFTSVFQYALQSHMLSVIWDIFIIEGWKGFFKCVLWILKHHQSALLNMQFDDILNYLSELIKSDFFKFAEQDLKDFGIVPNVENVKAEINQFKITSGFLQNIEQEYECFQVKLQNILKERKKQAQKALQEQQQQEQNQENNNQD